ncbi:ATP-binding protein [Prauserella sp. PE36]|nr:MULTISPECIES: ATP-binding protein [Pseudonocardiaceae]RBM18620.1 ATP-binding protein [Prauserella sp. PE36]
MPMSVEDAPEPLTLDLPGSVEVPLLVQVRQWAGSALNDLAEDHLNAVLLVCTELLTNAYDHADGSSQLRLRRNRVPCWVLIEVDDGVVEHQPVVGRSRLGDLRGRGLILVDKLSEDWGVRTHEAGKTVWARVSCEDVSRGISRCPEPSE